MKIRHQKQQHLTDSHPGFRLRCHNFDWFEPEIPNLTFIDIFFHQLILLTKLSRC